MEEETGTKFYSGLLDLWRFKALGFCGLGLRSLLVRVSGL